LVSVVRKQRSARAMAIALGLAQLGCAGAAIREPRVSGQSTHHEWTHTFLWGTVGDAEVDVRDHCPAGAAEVRAGGDAISTVLGIVTLGIYLPRVVRIRCAAGRPGSMRGAPDTAARGAGATAGKP